MQGMLDTDILAECFVELLLSSGHFSVENVHILPADQFRRNYANDITGIQIDEDWQNEPMSKGLDSSSEGLLKIFTSRSSLLNDLPETFYIDSFEPDIPENAHNKEALTLQRRKKQKRILESAHRFFKPLEVEYNKVRILRELEEVRLLEKYDDLLRSFWDTITDSTPEWDRFLRTLHLLPYVVGDRTKTQQLIEFVLEKPVSFSEKIVSEIELPGELQGTLGQVGLGFNFNMGNIIPCYVREITVTIKDLTPSEFFQYYDSISETGKLLQEIAKYYFPLDTDINFDFQINPEFAAFSLGGDEEHAAILGFSSKI